MNKLVLSIGLIILIIACNREDTKPPKVEISQPTDKATFYERDTVVITVDATDNEEVFEVRIFIDDVEYYKGYTRPFEYKYLTKGKVGDHVIKATAIDPSGNMGESKLQLFTVSTNSNPLANFSVSTEMATVGTDFTFDASGSTDSEDLLSDLSFRWDWTGDGAWDTDFSSTVVITHRYDIPGIYSVLMQVKDKQNNISQTSKSIIVKGFFDWKKRSKNPVIGGAN